MYVFMILFNIEKKLTARHDKLLHFQKRNQRASEHVNRKVLMML